MYDNDFDMRHGAFSTDDLDVGVTSPSFMKAAAPKIRSKPCTPVGGYKASSLKQPLNGRLKGNRMKRRSVSFAPNALTWSHDGLNGRQKLKNSCEEENGEDPDGMPSLVNSGRPTATQQFSHLPAFLQPEAPVRANGSADGTNSSDSDSDGSRPDSSDDDTFFTPTVNPTPSPALLANGTLHGADSDSGSDSDRSGASLSVASQATNIETESENEKENIPNGNTNDAAAGSGNDSDGSMVAGDGGNDSDGSVVFGSDDANKSDEEIPEFAKRKPTILPTARQRRLRTGILGASGNNSPLAAAKKGLSQGLSQLPGNRRFQPRLSSWSKKRREMRGLRPPPSYSRLQARKAMEAPSPIRRSDVYDVPSPTNAQGEESNTPKEGPRVKRTLELGECETASIVCSPADADALSSSSTNTTIVNTNGSPPTMNGEARENGARTAVSSADLKEVHTEIDSLKKMTHSVIEKLDTLSATFDELRHLNLAGRLDDQASTFGELKQMVSSHAQSTNDRITDLSTVVEILSNRVDSSHHLLESHADFIKRQEALESKAAAESVSSPKGSRSPRSPRRGASSSASSLDSLHESISELRSFTKENFERVQRSQQMLSSPRSRASSSPGSLTTRTLNRRLSANARKGRSKHAQQQARLARRGSAPGAKSSLAGSTKSREAQRPVRPRVCGYGSIAFLVMVVVLVWYFFPFIAPFLQGASQLI